MKKKITRIWGVGLTLILMASLLVWAAPVGAGNTLEWDDESEPSELDADNILDIAVGAGGLVIYVVDGTHELYVSQDGGRSWDTAIVNGDATWDGDLVAVAGDNPMYIAVCDTATGNVTISEDAGATWDTLDNSGVNTPVDIAISVESEGPFIAVAGANSTGGAEVFAYEIGSIGASWDGLHADDGFSGANLTGAIAFSPNFASDEVLVAVTANYGVNVEFQIYSFNNGLWNSGTFADFPAEVVADGTDKDLTTVEKLSVALSQDYLGSDGDLRVAFVGITATTALDEADGIFRLEDDDVENLKDEENIHSIDFDGTNLVAGDYSENKVYRSDDPLSSSPSVSTSSTMKGPGGTNRTVVAFSGDEVVAGTSGDENAFSVSEDLGKTFNDISLINTGLGDMLDLAVTPDGVIYLVTDNGTGLNLSLWRKASDWERVLSWEDTAASNWIVRFAPDDPDKIFLAEVAGTTIYYNSDAGDSAWRTRTSRSDYPIGDLAVEGDGTVLYNLVSQGAACHVSKSTNTGFTWGSKETTGMIQGPNMIASLAEDQLIVGSTDGTVAYSTDGNESWNDIAGEEMGEGDGLVFVTATGLNDGDWIFAATANDTDTDKIYQFEIGASDDWGDDIHDLTLPATGIANDGNLLYVLASRSDNATVWRTLDATGSSPTFRDVNAGTLDFAVSPSALRVSPGSNVLWAIDVTGDEFYSLEDTLITAMPTLRLPITDAEMVVNPVSGLIPTPSFVWEAPSDTITQYEFEVAFDSDFDDILTTNDFTTDATDEGDTHTYNGVTGASLTPDTTYYWRVRVDEPVRSGWATRSFTVSEAEGMPPVTVEIPPVPEVTVTVPPPQVTVTVPPMVQVPPAPAPVTPAFIWGIVILGVLLFGSLIVLIMRTRRVS